MLILFRVLHFLFLFIGALGLGYAPFYNRLRFCGKKLAGAWMAILLLAMIVYFVLLDYTSVKITCLFFSLLFFIASVCYIGSVIESPRKSLFVLTLVASYDTFIASCAIFIANLVTIRIAVEYEIIYIASFIFLVIITYRLFYRFISAKISPLLYLVGSTDLSLINFMPIFYVFLQALFFAIYNTTDQMSELVYFIVLVTLNASSYFTMASIFHILNETVNGMRMQEEISCADKLLELQKLQYAVWVTQVEDVRRARHDLKHHISIIQKFIDNDDKLGLQKHLDEFQRTMPKTSPPMLCKIFEINALLLHYYERAIQDDVKFVTHVYISDDFHINSQDLTVLFGNCLENAFEACSRMPDGEKKTVSIVAKSIGNGLAVVIDNTFDGNLSRVNDTFLSSKRQNQEGVGMTSIRLIVQKYSGVVTFEINENIFMTSIRLEGNPTD